MDQVSRPLLVALAAVVILAGVWLVALKPGNGGSGSSAPAAAPVPSASHAKVLPGPNPPGVGGLIHGVQNANGAVQTSQQDAARASGTSAGPASSPTSSASGSAPATPAAATGGTAAVPAVTAVVPATHAPGTASSKQTAQQLAAKLRAHAAPRDLAAPLLAELARGKVVVLLFWNPRGFDDQAVHRAVQRIGGGRVAVHTALIAQVSGYGAITNGVQVLQSPTVLVIGPNRKATAITGLTDDREISQTVGDVLRASKR